MKIMHINVVYPSGSTGKIVKDIHTQLLKNGKESIVCYGRGATIRGKNIFKLAPELIMKLQSLRSKLTGFAYAGCLFSTYKLIKMIKKHKPDIVHLHCINGYIVNVYKLLNYLKEVNIPTVLTLHSEFMYTAGCGHALECNKWKTGCFNCPQKGIGRPSSTIFDRSKEEWKMMMDAYNGFNNIIITTVSKWLYNRAIQSPFFKDKNIEVVFNGIDTLNVFMPTNTSKIRKKYSINNEKVILHVTPNFNSNIKGGKHVIELAKMLLEKNVYVFIVGFNGDKDTLPSNVIAISHISNQEELATFYSLADLTVLTSVRETFSMVCAESLACGTPVVGFEAGAPETIALEKYSEFVKQGDICALKNAVIQWIDKKQDFGESIYKEAREVYSKELMYNKYYNSYLKLIEGRV